jgi:hypothetical protein
MSNKIIQKAWLGNSDIDVIMRTQRKIVVSSIVAKAIELSMARRLDDRETPVRLER